MSASGLPGYMPGRPAHTINHIVVGDLGIKEIIVCTCDDGDVIVYYSDVILKAVNAIEGGAKMSDAVDRHIRPLMVKNVEKSAWGIAIHKNARLIAVSSNSCKIFVFAFALKAQEEPNGHGDGGNSLISSDFHEEQDFSTHPGWVKSAAGRWRIAEKFDRVRDQLITLKGHTANIPSVAFYNSETDPTGQHLISTDIYANIIIWDVWGGCGLKRLCLHKLNPLQKSPVLGWTIACIQPQTLRLASSDSEFLGCEASRMRGGGYDVSGGRSKLRDFAHTHKDHDRSQLQHLRQNGDDDVASADDMDQDTFMSDQSSEDISNQSSEHMSDQSSEDVSDEADHELLDDEESIEQVDGDVSQDSIDEVLPFGYISDPVAPALDHSMAAELSQPQADEYDNYPTDDGSMGVHKHPRRPLHYYSDSEEQTTPPSTPDFLIFHTGVSVVSLMHHPYEDMSAMCIDPCQQSLPDWLYHINNDYDRLSMTHQIPDLGIVIVGSAMGRVAIFTLTRRVKHAGTSKAKVTESCAMRLDWVLPFASQEARGERPSTLLIGVAVSPIQGREFSPEGRSCGTASREQGGRWRLILTYKDNSVLSYELWRGENEAGIKLDQLRF